MGICSAIIKLFVIYILRFCMYCLRIFPVKKDELYSIVTEGHNIHAIPNIF